MYPALILLTAMSLLSACKGSIEIRNECPVPVVNMDDCTAEWLKGARFPECVGAYFNRILRQQDALYCAKPENREKKFCK